MRSFVRTLRENAYSPLPGDASFRYCCRTIVFYVTRSTPTVAMVLFYLSVTHVQPEDHVHAFRTITILYDLLQKRIRLRTCCSRFTVAKKIHNNVFVVFVRGTNGIAVIQECSCIIINESITRNSEKRDNIYASSHVRYD